VEDDGPGFDEGLRLGDVLLSRKPNGTGVGLYGVMQLAEASGGRLLLGRGARGGARVVLTMPMAADPALALVGTATS